MDRRLFLQAAISAAALAASARAADDKPPPPNTTDVYLVGDAAPPDPQVLAARLSALVSRAAIRDSYLQDGAVADLERQFAALLGKEDCAFFPTGTMANQVAVRVQAGANHHVIVQQSSHLYRDESDAAQRLGELNLVPVAPTRASPTPDDIAAAIDQAENAPYPLRAGAIALESPIRRGFGEIVPFASVTAIADLARKHGARLHLDAARLLLAPPSLDLRTYVAPFDTVYVSLYKYLDAPFGAVLAGSKADMAQARDLRHVYGGLIYQGWIPALIAGDALRTFPDRNARAHAAADRILASLDTGGKIKVRRNPQASNIVMLDMQKADADALSLRSRREGIRVGKWHEGAVPFFINDTILRRPPAEIAAVLTG